MKRVTKIAPEPTCAPSQDKQRVAAYCRVSTGSDEQLESLDAQIKHYTTYIGRNPAWELAGIYSDEGITGTKLDKRSDLLRLISDCEAKQVDLIITKSISRFSRSTTDCLELVRKLTGLGIFIYFEKENIHTGSMESELMLSILSGLAENESTSISQNYKWSIQRRFQNGTYKIACAPYGYHAVDGKLVINEAEAEIVRSIYAAILSGVSTYRIALDLNRRNIATKRSGQWHSSTIKSMVANEKYTGDALFQKTYTDDYFNRQTNNGEQEQYLYKNHHEAIVSHEDFDAAQSVIFQRGKEKGAERDSKKYLKRYPFSGKIICSECGGTFKRRIHSKGRKYIAWTCHTHITDIKRCSMKYIEDVDLKYAFVTMMNKLIYGNQVILRPLLMSLRGINSEETMEKLKSLEAKLEENAEQQKVLVGLRAKGYLEPAVYKKSNNELLRESERIQHQKESITRFLNSDNKNLQEVSNLLQYTTKAKMLTEFDGELFSRFVGRIVVHTRYEVSFEMNCGITLKERLVR